METIYLAEELTETELRERGQKLAELVRKREQAVHEKAETAREYGEQIKRLDAEISEIDVIVRTKKENREVEVERRKNFLRNVEETTRLDTGEIVESRALTAAERQAQLFPGAETANA